MEQQSTAKRSFLANTISAVPEKGCRNVVVVQLQSCKYCNVLTRTVQYMMNESRESEGSALSTPGGLGEKCTAKPVTLLDSFSNVL
jgi:hypothetical protein